MKGIIDIQLYADAKGGPAAQLTAYGSETMTAMELEKFADQIRAKAKELRAMTNKHAQAQRSKW